MRVRIEQVLNDVQDKDMKQLRINGPDYKIVRQTMPNLTTGPALKLAGQPSIV